jgi:hypothetical protein
MTNATAEYEPQLEARGSTRRWPVDPGNRLRRCTAPNGGTDGSWVLERGDGLRLTIETVRRLRPRVPYSVTLLNAADALRVANVNTFAEAVRLAQAPASELHQYRQRSLTAYEQFRKEAALSLQTARRSGR